MLYALDIETKCVVVGCTDRSCTHALIPHLSEKTVIGVWSPTDQIVFRSEHPSGCVRKFEAWVKNENPTFVLHNGKFDYKKILFEKWKGISVDTWVGDTQLMAYASIKKVPQLYLEQYAEKRKEENKKLPRGYSHRDAGPLSLKTLAPFYLGVPPFWEDPSNHDSDEYVLKDCEYTYRLYEHFQKTLDKEDLEFAETKLLPWSKMLLEAELRGIQIDSELLKKKKADAELKVTELKRQLDEQWKDAYEKHWNDSCVGLKWDYDDKAAIAVDKLKDKTPEKIAAIVKRYDILFEKAADKTEREINLDSPKQLQWLLKDYLGLDTTSMKEDDKESTGKDVLNRLYNETGREDLKIFLAYREQKKLLTAFFPSYEELMDHDGILRCSFNITGTRTGRLSSSSPNLQQVPSDLHSLFVARDGYKLVTRDMSYIEPRLIAYYTEDPFLCDLILRDGDFHSRNAIIMFGLECDEKEVKDLYPKERKLAKTVGLALLYGAGPNRIHQTANQQGFDWTIDQCKEIYNRFKEEYEHIYKWKEELDFTACNRPLKNMFGFRFSLEEFVTDDQRAYINKTKDYRAVPYEVKLKAFNTLIQGSASMMVIDAARKIKTFGYEPLLAVHDELVTEVPENRVAQAEEIIENMMTSFELPTSYGRIPLKVEGKTGRTWQK